MNIGALLFGDRDAGSFVAAGARGLERAASELGVSIDASYCPAPTQAARSSALAAIAGSGVSLVVVHGGQGDAPVAHVAPDFPHVMFAISQGSVIARNIASYEVLLEQSVFLAGAFAAAYSANGVIGFVSGERVRPGLKACAAFAMSARRVCPQVAVLTSFCGAQHDAALAHRYTLAQIGRGADVIFTMLGSGRAGAIAACRGRGAKLIGDGIDWCSLMPDVFVAAALADVSWGPYQAVRDFASGRFEAERHRAVGLERPELCRFIVAPSIGAQFQARQAALVGDILSSVVALPETWDGPEFEPGAGC